MAEKNWAGRCMHACMHVSSCVVRSNVFFSQSKIVSKRCPSRFFLRPSHIRVDPLLYKSKSTDKWEQYDWRVGKKIERVEKVLIPLEDAANNTQHNPWKRVDERQTWLQSPKFLYGWNTHVVRSLAKEDNSEVGEVLLVLSDFRIPVWNLLR